MTAVMRNIAAVYGSPRRLFERVEESTPYGWALGVLLLLLALCGYVVVVSGLVEREVDQAAERAVARFESARLGEISQARLDEEMGELREAKWFWNVMSSGWRILASPVNIVGRIFVGAGIIYVVVALSGRRPIYGLAVTIFVYAGYTEVLREVLRVYLMLSGLTTDVDTSLAAALPSGTVAWGPLWVALRAVDPFAVWFWRLVAAGVVITRQLPVRRAVVVCVMLGLVEGLGHAGVDVLFDFAKRGSIG